MEFPRAKHIRRCGAFVGNLEFRTRLIFNNITITPRGRPRLTPDFGMSDLALKAIGPPEIDAAIPSLSHTLSGLAIPERSAVVLALESPWDFALLAGALPSLRATAPAEVQTGTAGAERLLHRIRPSLVVTDRFDSDLARAARGAGVAVARPVSDERMLLLETVPPGSISAHYPSGIALLLQTTGTTGEPKLVGLTRANLAASINAIVESARLGPTDRTATIMPMTHIHGLVAVLHASIAAGGSVVPIVPRDPEAFWRGLDRIRPTWLSLVPTLLQDLLETAPSDRPASLSELRLLRTSSAALPLGLRRRAEDYFGVPLIEAYGMTEACHQIASGRPGDIRPGSVGRPGVRTHVTVLGLDGSAEPGGAAGELCVRGPGIFGGYLWPEDANETAFHGPWFRTGDIGRIDDNGMIWLTGRIKEQINRGGETLSPRDIEEVLLSHPAIAEAVVFPLPHARLGEEVAALCASRAGTSVDAATLIGFASERLAFAQVPKTIFFADAVPRAASGKVSRMAIAAAYRDRAAGLPAPGGEPGDPVWRDRLRLEFADVLRLPDIDDHAAFFMLGGTSLHALRLVARLEARYGVRLPPAVLMTHPTIAGLANAIAAGGAGGAILVDATPGQTIPIATRVPGLEVAIPASQLVAAIYLGERVQPDPHPMRGRTWVRMRLRDGTTFEAAAAAFHRLVIAQAALRHRAAMDENGQVVFREMPEQAWPRLLKMTVSAPAAEIEQHPNVIPEFRLFAEEDADAPVRAAWVRGSGDGVFLLVLLHETVADGYARALLPALMASALGGRDLPPHQPFSALMAAVCAREVRPPEAAAVETDATWLHQDGDGERRRNVVIVEAPLEAGIWHRVEALARTTSLTPFAICWTAFALLLERIAGGPIPIWSALQRRREEADFATIGNATALVRCIAGTASGGFIAIARRAMHRFLDAIGDVSGDTLKHGMPACCFEFEDEAQRLREIHPALAPDDHVVWSRDLPESVAEWDLRLAVRPPDGTEAGLLRVIVDPASFRRPRAESLLPAYAHLLKAVLAAPDTPPESLPVAITFDRPSTWPSRPLGGAVALHAEMVDMAELFAAIARRWPDSASLAWSGGGMTFNQIEGAAAAVNATLRSHGVVPADVIAFRLTGDVDPRDLALFIATQIAAFQLGCALLPLGQQLPAAQARAQIETTGARFLIAATRDPDCRPALTADEAGGISDVKPPDAKARRVGLDHFPGACLLVGDDRQPRGEGGTAILLTSSGTTGQPKTIRLTQAMLLGILRAVAATGRLPPAPGLLGQNIGFDAVITDVWMPWLFGRHVVVLDTERRSPPALADARRLGAKVLSLSPTVATAALNDAANCFSGFEAIILIGEVVPPALVRRLEENAPGCGILNGYGPAETAVLATLADVRSDNEPNVTIGWTLPGYRVVIVDPLLRPLPPHWPGELAIACPAPAHGYLDTEMTAARFVELPDEATGPFFRTGDIGWVDEAGQARFIGRRDRQFKLAGVRVEIDGVEHRIAEVEGVADAGVVFLDDPPRQRLIAVVQPSAPAGSADDRDESALADRILAHCRTWLPRAAVPSEIIFVDAMPMGATGKKSHTALRQMVAGRMGQTRPASDTLEEAPPEPGSIEARLLGLWRDLFDASGIAVTAVRPEDDVFALGVTSLDALRMVERIEREFGRGFPDHQIFLRRTINAQAALVRESGRPAGKAAPVVAAVSLELHLVRPARGDAASRGMVLGLPLLDGGIPYLGVVGEKALLDYDLWGFTVDIGDRDPTGVEPWIDCAHAIVARLLAHDGPRPRALLGFSIGGFLGWLIDRLLVAAGWDVTPIVNLDGGTVHTLLEGWRSEVQAALPLAVGAPAARMLLVQRKPLRRLTSGRRPDIEWAEQGVAPEIVNCRTIRHLDVLRPEVFATTKDAMATFLETGTLHADFRESGVNVETPGGLLFQLLEGQDRPSATQVRAFVGALPSDPVDQDFRLGLLCIALACGEPGLALAVAARLGVEQSDDRAPVYAQAAILAELGRHLEAIELVRAWSVGRPPDPGLRRRAWMRRTIRSGKMKLSAPHRVSAK
jgi:acyl-CoA synthetase (AMP-forming)/AMP-acid ligase II/acyl carrier protein